MMKKRLFLLWLISTATAYVVAAPRLMGHDELSNRVTCRELTCAVLQNTRLLLLNPVTVACTTRGFYQLFWGPDPCQNFEGWWWTAGAVAVAGCKILLTYVEDLLAAPAQGGRVAARQARTNRPTQEAPCPAVCYYINQPKLIIGTVIPVCSTIALYQMSGKTETCQVPANAKLWLTWAAGTLGYYRIFGEGRWLANYE